MTRQGHCFNRTVSLNMVLRVGSCDAGTTVPQKKEPGHAFQPVQFPLVFLTSQRDVRPLGPRTSVYSLPQHRLAAALRLNNCQLCSD
jgi:hypothetical protein